VTEETAALEALPVKLKELGEETGRIWDVDLRRTFIKSRWRQNWGHIKLDVEFGERITNSRPVVLRCNNLNLGDRLTDNIRVCIIAVNRLSMPGTSTQVLSGIGLLFRLLARLALWSFI
jgi:hypothetical protein